MTDVRRHPVRVPYRVFYDGRCNLCTRSRDLIRRLDRGGTRFEFVDLHDATAMAAFPMIDPVAVRGRMHVLSPDGRVAAGYDAVALLAEPYRGTGVLRRIMRVGWVRRIGTSAYGWIAENRYVFGHASCQGTCRI